jgi:hypothetical protein
MRWAANASEKRTEIMMRYFVAGNFWLAIALAAFTGQTWERSNPTRYSFFGVGGWMTPTSYNLILLLCLALAAVFFSMAWKRRQIKASAFKEPFRAFD